MIRVSIKPGAVQLLTPRNRLLDMPSLDNRPEICYFLAEEIVAPLIDLAARCAGDHDQAVASLRLLNAVTLMRRQFFTEAFVTGWSLIETCVERGFTTYWRGWGRSKSAIDDMDRDWKASQQTDLLIAVGTLDPTMGERIHRLRKRRNAIVHDLADATQQEALDCIEVASALTPLPQFAEALRPAMVLL